MNDGVRVFLAGEGRSELGSRAGHPAYQSDEQPGFVEVLLRRIQSDGWSVGGVREWKSVRNLRVGIGANDAKRVVALALDAREAGCQVLAFVRDRDNDRDRIGRIEQGMTEAQEPGELGIIGGVAVPLLEGWVLALGGGTDSEALSPTAAKERLIESGVSGAEAYAEVARTVHLDAIPDDATSLNRWLVRARAVLPPAVHRAKNPGS